MYRLRVATTIVWLSMGIGQTFGPSDWRSSPSFEVIGRFMPLRVWGLVFIAIAAIQTAGLLRPRTMPWGLIVGALVAAAWATSFVADALIHELTGFAGPSLWAFLAFAQVCEAGMPARRRHRRVG